MSSQLFYIHALSPLHMGTGAAVGGIDLPHSREAASRLPNVPGSGIKGIWRDQFSTSPDITRLFGSDWSEGTRDQGALLFSDAWLLCMPVMSYVGDFAWVTSPMSLARFARERRYTLPNATPPALPQLPTNQAMVTNVCKLQHADDLYLHELKIKASNNPHAQAWAELIAGEVFSGEADFFQTAFIQRFVVVPEAELVQLSHAAAHVPMRNALDDIKTVKDGALWSEENMPVETIFWGTVAADTLQDRNNSTHKAIDSLAQFTALAQRTPRLQLGGKATIGRGMCRFVVPNQAKQGAA